MDRDEYAAFLILNNKLNKLLTMLGDEVMPGLDELEIEVSRAVTAIEQAKAKIDQLIASGTVSQEQVSTLAARLRAATDSLATPSPPPPEEEGAPETSQFRRR